MLLSEILQHISENGVGYTAVNFIDTEITQLSVPSGSDDNSILFFSKVPPDTFTFNYGACLVKNTIALPKDTTLRNIIQVKNPRLAIILIAHLFKPYFSQNEQSISERAVIHPEASIGKNVIIMDNAVLGRCVIGDYTIVYPNVVIYDDVEIGSFCEVNANTTLGAEGMGGEKQADGRSLKFPHFSSLIIKDNVFIGPNTTISRGVLTPTVIESHCRINALTHIAHNCHIGENSYASVGVMVCGSARIGANCTLAPNSTIRDGVTIADNITVGMGAVVTKSFLESGVTLVGTPAHILP